ncbi:MAG: DNA double-strand break repair nuclease NurA [Methanosarcinaceae archaeon]|nr:DNA double-strand break repair nuclease NurA [Methanosarcinaceae archaeon]MDD4332176.1 DNA double-strand break repair nuclease NurA [Methanosarcinaceae archaeon]
MTLEPVHMKKISELAQRIDYSFESEEPRTATDIYLLLEELKVEGKTVLKAVDRLFRGRVRTALMAQCKEPYPITYACDSGSTNPRTYDSGLFVDFCHCALASTPTELELQRYRTIVCAAYTASQRATVQESDAWEFFDAGRGRARLIKIEPDELKKKVPDLVHNMAMYLAESEHILFMLEKLEARQAKKDKEMDKEKQNDAALKQALNPDLNPNSSLENPLEESFFIMDGPLYPKQLMYWLVLEDEEVRIYRNKHSEKILQNYIDIMDHFLEKNAPVIGFVKNPGDMQLMDAIRKRGEYLELPWMLDAQFFKKVLSPEQHFSGPKQEEEKFRGLENLPRERRRPDNTFITYTNWFLQPNRFYERLLKDSSPLAARELKHKFPAEDYAVSFFMAYLPAKDMLFKIEAPYGLIKNENLRNRIVKKVLFDLALNSFPLTLTKADHVAKIRKVEREVIDKQFVSMKPDITYNDLRWKKDYDI